MRFGKKEISILIFTSGSWRSRFFQRLFSKWALVQRVNPCKEKVPLALHDYDVILWESAINKVPPPNIDENRLFIFDYKDEGKREDLVQITARWGIKKPRFLILLPEKNQNDTGCLPLPYPNLIWNFKSPPLLKDRKYDTFFLCAPTFVYLSEFKELPYCIRHQERYCYNQRIEWVEHLVNSNLLGEKQGLIHSNHKYLKKDNIATMFNFYK